MRRVVGEVAASNRGIDSNIILKKYDGDKFGQI
jgi:hypothetical protein